MKGRGGSLIALLLTAALLVGALLLWRVSQEATAAPAARPNRHKLKWNGLAQPVALNAAQARAAERVAQWAEDAYLFKAEATWRPPEDMLTAKQLPLAWSFYYYSASQAKVAIVEINGEKVFWAPPVALANSPTTLEHFPPQHGVESAWLSFRAAGGEELLKSHTDALVQYQLRQATNGREWTVTAFHKEGTFEVIVNADTGLVQSKINTSTQE